MQYFVCFAKKSVNRKPFLVSTIFSQRRHRENLEAYLFLSGNKVFCSLTAILHWIILFHECDQLKYLLLIFFGYKKAFWGLRCKQGYKNEKLVTKKFSNFLRKPNSIFRRNANRALVSKTPLFSCKCTVLRHKALMRKIMVSLQYCEWDCHFYMYTQSS